MATSYNFKTLTIVPSAKDLVDITLSKTQRKTPTVVHPQYKITRIRDFYMRKVKFTAENYVERMSMIIDQFPQLDEIHPFYADLINVLYDRDHYKLALGQVNTARHVVEKIGKDHTKLLKFADSLYRCKQLKKAALGRMCTIVKKLNASLGYLEQVRQHLSRLPTIDPATRTLILCGFPNVGKSSFLNHISRAQVDVQPYPFTTKSLFVGHCDHQYLRFQVIDTPGILDRPLEERNTIEMQAVTAMAHLRAAILFLIDISGECGYSIEQQIQLFQVIKPLFAGKPLIIVANKTDVRPLDQLSPRDQGLLNQILVDNPDAQLVPMSNISEEGIMNVKSVACEKLLSQRVEQKFSSKKLQPNLNRLHIAMPQPRDNKARPAFIPESVLKAQNNNEDMEVDDWVDESILEREKHLPEWLRGFGSLRWKERYLLKDDDWRFDQVPEIYNGHNIADFIDPDIWDKLDQLEIEEAQRLQNLEEEEALDDFSDLDEEQKLELAAIRRKKNFLREQRALKLVRNKGRMGRHGRSDQILDEMDQHLTELGIDTSNALARIRQSNQMRSLSRQGRALSRSKSLAPLPEGNPVEKSVRAVSRTRSPSKSAAFKNFEQEVSAAKIKFRKQKIFRNSYQKHESDHSVPSLKPRHLFKGKRGSGTSDWR